MKCRKTMTKLVAHAALLLALAFSPAVVGQDEGYDPYGGATWLGFEEDAGGGATWLGFEEDAGGGATWSDFANGDDVPLGGGLLVLALSGVCYAGAKRVKSLRV